MSAESHNRTVSGDASYLEAGDRLRLDFQKLQSVAACGEAVAPVVVQHADTREVLILAYVNQEALRRSLAEGIAVLYSTSRNELWIKGATSGDYLDLVEVRVNCEQNSLLFLVRPRTEHGGVCHTRDEQGRTRPSCYYRRVLDPQRLEFREGQR